MISYLKGTAYKSRLLPGFVTVETAAGIGYELRVAEGELREDYFVWHYVHERGQSLYGFSSLYERELAIAISGTSGIGGGTAAAIVHALGGEKAGELISAGDAAVLAKTLKGVGKAGAGKIITYMKKLHKRLLPDVGLTHYHEAVIALEDLGHRVMIQELQADYAGDKASTVINLYLKARRES